MIYRTTVAFIFTLFLTQIARALPQAIDDHIFPASESDQHRLPHGGSPHALRPVITEDPIYDNPLGLMSSLACSNPLEPRYPYFGDIPNFPWVGGAYDVVWGSLNCGQCWRLTNLENGAFIYLVAINRSPNGFNIGSWAYNALMNGDGRDVSMVDAVKVPGRFCGF